MEAIHKNLSAIVMAPTLMACMTTTVLVHWVFGVETVLTIPKMPILPVELLPQVIVLGLVSGLIGVAFNKGSLNISRFYSLPVFRKPWMKIAFPLLLTIPLTYLLPQILGAGDNIIEAMVDLEGTLGMVLVILLGKFFFTIFSTGSGAPGGSLQPMLVLGSWWGACTGTCWCSWGSCRKLPAEYGGLRHGRPVCRLRPGTGDGHPAAFGNDRPVLPSGTFGHCDPVCLCGRGNRP